MGAPSGTGSRASTEPGSTVSALTGFDPSRIGDLPERLFAHSISELVSEDEEEGPSAFFYEVQDAAHLLAAIRSAVDSPSGFDPSRIALEPFAAMARLLQRSLVFNGGKATDQTKVMVADGECGLCVLTYGHFLDALAAFGADARGWGGMYENPGIRPALVAATGTAKTAQRVECEAPQSGPKGNAQPSSGNPQ